MVRFARPAVKPTPSRSASRALPSGRDKVAICGYHGWHDWYLAANLGDDSTLAGHLLPGLEPKGVPQHLRGSVLPFNYNDFATLEGWSRDRDVGVIKMEVVAQPRARQTISWQRVRKLATDKGIVLIFDECIFGLPADLRRSAQAATASNPDMAIFGKTLGNGYAITATIGRREIMEAAQSTFISSTFWTERIGPAAALKTLEVMERVRSWEPITRIGTAIGERWQALARKYELPLSSTEFPRSSALASN